MLLLLLSGITRNCSCLAEGKAIKIIQLQGSILFLEINAQVEVASNFISSWISWGVLNLCRVQAERIECDIYQTV